MDRLTFDCVTRLLGTAASRRSGLAAAIAAAVAARSTDGATPGESAAIAADAPPRRARRRVRPEGPCGNGSRAENICTKDKQCCTGICNLKTGKKNTDGRGRCRCLKRGRTCSADKNCCNSMTCVDGACSSLRPVPTSQACVAARDTCLDDAASCMAYDSDDPAGTFCLLPTGAACSGDNDCWSQDCSGGTCAAVVCDVCLAGCAYTSIADAIASPPADRRIRVAPGTWTGADAFTEDIRIEACGGAPGVIITPTRSACIELATGGLTVTVKGLEFSYGASLSAYTLVAATGASASSMAGLDIRNCTFDDRTGTVKIGLYLFSFFTATVTNSTFLDAYVTAGSDVNGALDDPSSIAMSGCTMTTAGGSSLAGFDNSVNATLTDCTVSGGSSTTGGGIVFSSGVNAFTGSLTLNGSTTVSGNTAGDGGGVALRATDGASVALILADSAMVTSNTATNGSGLAVITGSLGTQTGTVTVSGAAGRITGNSGASSQCAETIDGSATWTAVPDCTTF
ncbi:MAG: right-handed parallel beta-helix repeat-containing protein [Chloroflexota bacterium]